jgi:hypothetical protein
MDCIIRVHLQLPKVEKPYGPPVIVYSELGLRALFLGILATPEFYNWYEFPCFAEKAGTVYPSPETLEGHAIYRKLNSKLTEQFASGPFVGLLERILPQQ